MKKIVITGGTGLIGNSISNLLLSNGYAVTILTRNPQKYNNIENLNYEKLDFSSENNIEDILDGAYSVINLAGASIAGKRWTDNYKQEIYNSRINTTSYLVNAINKLSNPPKSFISASAIGIYGNNGDNEVREDSLLGNDFMSKVCKDWESEAQKCNTNTRLVIGRIGVVLSSKGGALPKIAMPIKMFVGGAIGSGKQWMPWIHIDDLAKLFLYSVENDDMRGIYNFVSPEPTRMGDFVKTLGKVLNRPTFFNVPSLVVKLAMGESAIVVTEGQKVIPYNLEKISYKFEYISLEKAFINIYQV